MNLFSVEMSVMRVLIVEDNVQLLSNIIRYLSLHNITCEWATDGKEWLYKILTGNYDVAILDIELPSLSWMEILKKVREEGKSIPVLFLTCQSTKQDIVRWLHSGADDYVTKPFDFEELLARIQALYRRDLKHKGNTLYFKHFLIDFEKKQVFDTRSQKEVELSHKEYELLSFFIKNHGKTLSKQEIYEKVWGEMNWEFSSMKTVEVYIGYLRKKLWNDTIKTVKGQGYLFTL